MRKFLQAAMASSVLLSGITGAQTTGSVFALTGDYIKIGVSDYGTIGSKGNTTPGIMYDNTGTRTFNPSYDYLTPGAPFEGFSIKATAGGTPFSVTNNNMGGGPLTGVLTNYSGIAYSGATFDNRAVWVSTNNANFDLTNDVRFNNSQKFVDITTSLSAKVAMTDLYFARFIDPDARAAAGDSSATTNTLGYGPIPATNVVFSEALASKYALGLYSGQVGNVGTGISATWSTDPATYYSGTNDGNGDYTIGIAFRVSSLGIGDLATFRYAYIFGPSTLTAGAYAVTAGAGGGTPGVVPGCVSSCDLAGVTPPASPSSTEPEAGPPPAPTIVASVTNWLYARLSVFNREPGSSVLNIRNTIAESTTPVTVDTYSDGSSVTNIGATATAEAVTNYSTRIDQYQYMDRANQRFNQQLDSNVLDRWKSTTAGLYNRSNGNDNFNTYVIAEGQRTNTDTNGYYMSAQRFGIGTEKRIAPGWVVGGMFNNITANLYGDQAAGNMQKNAVTAYSLYNIKDWLFKADLGVSTNSFKNSHTLNNIEELGPLSAGGTGSGRDLWLSARAYTPSFWGFRPYVGVRAENTQRGAISETGSSLIAMNYDSRSQTQTFGDAGVRYENSLGINKLNVLAEGGATTNGITYVRAGASYRPFSNVAAQFTVGQQRQDGVNNNIIQGLIKIAF
jgi:hypothetical protein